MGEHRSGPISNAILLACVLALVVGALAVLRSFLPAILWATIIVVATWPIMLRLQKLLGGRRGLAVGAMSGGLLLAVIAPVVLLLGTLIAHLPEMKDLGNQLLAGPWPGPPAWLLRLPYGAELTAQWQQAIAQDADHWAAYVTPYIGKAALWLSQHVGTIGGITLQFLLTLVLVAVFYLQGESLTTQVRRLAWRVGGPRAVEGVVLAGQTMRAIAAGVVLTALLQSILGGCGLWIVGIPAAGVLTSLMFVLCLMQIGPLPVLVPAALWLMFHQQVGWGVALAVWAGLLSVVDNLLRPWLIQRGAKLPFLLVLGGVLGGLLAFGIAGIFVGPILLAVLQRLVARWVEDQ
jgi:predicted PurR-regulated permease PerM